MATVPPCRAAGEEGWVICGGHRAQISGSQSVVWELLGIPKIFSRRLQGFNYFKKIFVYLAAPGLSRDTWDLQSSLRHAESLIVACKLLVTACGI